MQLTNKKQINEALAKFNKISGLGLKQLAKLDEKFELIMVMKDLVYERAETQESHNKQYKQFIDDTVSDLKKDMTTLHEYFGTLKTQNEALMAANSGDEQGASMQQMMLLLKELKDA